MDGLAEYPVGMVAGFRKGRSLVGVFEWMEL